MCVHVDLNQFISVLCELIYTLSSNILNNHFQSVSNVVMLIIYFKIRNYSQPYPNCTEESSYILPYFLLYFYFVRQCPPLPSIIQKWRYMHVSVNELSDYRLANTLNDFLHCSIDLQILCRNFFFTNYNFFYLIIWFPLVCMLKSTSPCHKFYPHKQTKQLIKHKILEFKLKV